MHASSAETILADSLCSVYQNVRETTLRIAQMFSPEDQMLQSMPEASPLKWHLAHTTWFFESFVLAPHVPDYRTVDPRFRQLFNSYYKQLGEHPSRGARGLMSRPSHEEVLAYRRSVDEALAEFAGHAPDAVRKLVELG